MANNLKTNLRLAAVDFALQAQRSGLQSNGERITVTASKILYFLETGYTPREDHTGAPPEKATRSGRRR